MKPSVLLLIVVLLTLACATAVLARVGGGDIVYEVKHIGNVVFHHDTHVETMGFTCTKCHPFIFESKARHVTLRMSHRRQAMSCGTCHNGKDAFDLSTNCYVCHMREGK